MEFRVGFVGAGVMGEAMISRLLGNGILAPQDIVAADVTPERRQHVAEKYGVHTTSSNLEAASPSAMVVLAVKPQHLSQVMGDLRGRLRPEQTVLSIVAGTTITTLRDGLAHPSVIRVMPNTPAQIGEGISVWTATPAVPQDKKEMGQAILKALGEEIYVTDEKFIDMATALSGSGPAYAFLFIESLIDAGVHIGMPRDMAHKLAVQTVLGAAQFAKATGKHPAELKNMVTSPGGTTAEGLLALEEGRLRAQIILGVIAAYEKARALGATKEIHLEAQPEG